MKPTSKIIYSHIINEEEVEYLITHCEDGSIWKTTARKTTAPETKTMTKINSKLMIDYDDNNSYIDFITEKGIKYYTSSIREYENDYSITYICKDKIKPAFIQQKLDNDVIKIWEYSEELAKSLGLEEMSFKQIFECKYWLAIDTIEEEIKEYIEVEYGASRISYKEYDRKLNQYEDDDITHTIENIEYMIEKEYGENATLAEIKEDSEYNYNLLIASTYLRTKHKL